MDPSTRAWSILLEFARRPAPAGGLPDAAEQGLAYIAETGNLAAVSPTVCMIGAWRVLARHAGQQAELHEAEWTAGTVEWVTGRALRHLALDFAARLDAARVATPRCTTGGRCTAYGTGSL